MAYDESVKVKPSLFSAITIGVSSIIGSGWLFACYKTAQFTGPSAIYSWIIGALITLCPALLLAEIATYFHKENAVSARLLTLTHNKDIGFLISLPNWFYITLLVPAEAEATVQYLSDAFESIGGHILVNGHLTGLGIMFVCLFMCLYLLVNYWGIKLLSRVNNAITIIKFIVPIMTALMFIYASYNPSNFTSYQGTIAPYGYDKIFTAVVTCGIFYSFYGFGPVALFSRELDNPQRNIPIALVGSIIISAVIYVILQYSFIVAVTPEMIANGWHNLNFNSPLAELAILLSMNWLAVLLFIDSAISPSGSGVIFLGSSARIFTGMAQDKQMPKLFGKEHPNYMISRISLVFSLIFCTSLVIFFNNWEKMMIMVSVFMCLSCIAIPVSYCRLRKNDPHTKRPFAMVGGTFISYIVFTSVTYLLAQCGSIALMVSVMFLLVFFCIYCSIHYKNLYKSWMAFLSSWSMFVYLVIMTIFAYLTEKQIFSELITALLLISVTSICYYFMINQKNYND